MDFKQSETRKNLMRAFAGESQARNRYTFAASAAKAQKLHIIEWLFTLTADQEKEHAKLFYEQLKSESGTNIEFDAAYPVMVTKNIGELLRDAHHNEYEEYEIAYPAFADVAEQEGFANVARLFRQIAPIEKVHGDRFLRIAEMYEQGTLFADNGETLWYCANCGHIHKSGSVPEVCPVCAHPKGYFLRFENSPFAK